MERRLSAILAADVVGYSRLVGADEEGTLSSLRSLRIDIIEPLIAEHRGRVVKLMGDGFLVEFQSAVDAVKCAVDWQTRLAAPQSETTLVFRIGINLGDIVIDGDDILGDGVNIAARLEALADPGSLSISASIYEQIRDRLELVFENMGEQSVKNIDRPVQVWRWAPHVSPTAHVTSSPSAWPEKPSVAVLPFTNMSGDPEQEYFADGMVDEIITGLARIRWLTVIARNSTFTYKGKSHDIRDVGRDLSVRYVMEGSVRKAGNAVRITVQLAESETGGQIWADRFDGTLEDIFDLQDEITAGVVAAIEPSVRQAEIVRAKRKRPDSMDAYDLYLRGLEQSYIYTQDARAAGLEYLDAAIALDADYAEAHGVAAFCLQQRYLWGGRNASDREGALRHAKAVEVSRTNDASALAFSAMVLSALDGRHDTAMVILDRAVEQNPSSAVAHSCYALVSMISGKPELSVTHAEQALRLSPFDPMRHIPLNVLSVANLVAGNLQDAVTFALKGVEANPVFLPGLITLALCLVALDRTEEAADHVRKILEIAPDTCIATLRERYLLSNGIGIDRVIRDMRRAGLPENAPDSQA